MTPFSPALVTRATALIGACTTRGLMLATAESCTGGLVAALLTEPPGASAVFERGFATYSNRAKQEMLDVPAVLIARYGAVSAPCALAMATGAIAHSGADIAVSITGIAGPGGGSADKPVGLVHFAVLRRGGPATQVERRFGDRGRGAVRLAALIEALDLFEAALGA